MDAKLARQYLLNWKSAAGAQRNEALVSHKQLNDGATVHGGTRRLPNFPCASMRGTKDTDSQRDFDTQGISLRGCLFNFLYKTTIVFEFVDKTVQTLIRDALTAGCGTEI